MPHATCHMPHATTPTTFFSQLTPAAFHARTTATTTAMNAKGLAGIKRPRSAAIAGSGAGAAKKGRPSDPEQQRTSLTASSAQGAPGEESTATAEGALMADVLGRLPPSELERFEAYKRVAFPAGALSAYVSHRLVQNEEVRYVRRSQGGSNLLGAPPGLGIVARNGMVAAALGRCPHRAGEGPAAATGGGGGGGVAIEPPPLRDVVAPESSREICIVVSTLAKAYAQRLVAAALRVARAEGYPRGRPLLPHHLSEAHRHRVRAGSDPGFIMGGGSGGTDASPAGHGGAGTGLTAAGAAALGIKDGHALRLDAALAAQEEYDWAMEAAAEEEKKE